MHDTNPFEGAEIIHVYTRAQAIEDGTLVDLTEWASADKGFLGGFRVPVAVTAAVWADINAIPKTPRCACQDVRGRAHDVLWMASLAARSAGGNNPVLFLVYLDIAKVRRRKQVYKLHIGGGDNGEAVVTIMQRGED